MRALRNLCNKAVAITAKEQSWYGDNDGATTIDQEIYNRLEMAPELHREAINQIDKLRTEMNNGTLV